MLLSSSELHALNKGQYLARELVALDTRLPDAIVASMAGDVVALEDVPIGTVGVDRLVAAELTLNFVAEAFGGDAGLINFRCEQGQ